MLHPLQQKVRSIGWHARCLMLAAGLALTLAVLVSMATLAGMLDYHWLGRMKHGAWPVVLSACVALATLVAAWRWLLPTLRAPLGELFIARRIEFRFPQLSDRLSSSLEFLALAENDAGGGSLAMRNAVVLQTAQAVEQLPLGQTLDARPTWRCVLLLALVATVAGSIVSTDLEISAQAIQRLAMPWNPQPWPKWHELRFVDPPSRIAQGEPLELVLVDDRGQLPDDVQIELQYSGAEDRVSIVEPMTRLGERMLFRLDRATGPLRFRATGGDDQEMDWHELAVVEPSRLVSLQIVLQPPEYTGARAIPGDRHIRALVGTRVDLSALVSSSVESARLVFEDGNSRRHLFSLKLSRDGTALSLTTAGAIANDVWTIKKSGSYWIELRDAQGMVTGGGTRWQVQAVADEPPSVKIESPEPEAVATAQATVAIRVLAADQLALREVRWEFRVETAANAKQRSLVLYRGPNRLPPAAIQLTGGEDRRTVNFEWDLATIPQLQPGTKLICEAVAVDHRPGDVGVRSPPQTLTIVSPQQLEQRVAGQLADLESTLREMLQAQREVRSLVQSLEDQLKTAKKLGPRELIDLDRAELNQRRIDSLAAGIIERVKASREQLRLNRIDRPDTAKRLESVEAALAMIQRDYLPAIEQQLLSAQKRAADAGGQATLVTLAIADVGQQQDRVIAALEELLDELSRWDRFRSFAVEVSRLRDQQQELSQQTQILRTRGKRLDNLDAEERLELDRLLQHQGRIALESDRLLERMRIAATELRATDVEAAKTLVAALEVALRQNLSGKVQDARDALADNRVDESRRHQSLAVRTLDAMLEQLLRRSRQGAAAHLEQELLDIQTRQTDLLASVRRIEKERPKQGELPRANQRELLLLAEQERGLYQAVVQLGEGAAEQEVLRFALAEIGNHLQQASEELSRRESGQRSQQPMQRAIDGLESLLQALRAPKPAAETKTDPVTDIKPMTKPSQGQQDLQVELTEVILLEKLQQDLRLRTAELVKQRDAGQAWAAEQEKELGLLARQQRQLSEMISRMIKRIENPADKSPQPIKVPMIRPATPPSKLPRDLEKQIDDAIDELLPPPAPAVPPKK